MLNKYLYNLLHKAKCQWELLRWKECLLLLIKNLNPLLRYRSKKTKTKDIEHTSVIAYIFIFIKICETICVPINMFCLRKTKDKT